MIACDGFHPARSGFRCDVQGHDTLFPTGAARMMLPMRWILPVLIPVFMTCRVPGAPAAALPDAAIALQQDIRRELGPQRTRLSPRQTRRAMELGMDMLDRTGNWPADTEVILVVDRAPAVQLMWFVLSDPARHDLTPLGMVAVSTGRPGRKEHFRTPVGIFRNDGQIYGYRALGTKNEYGIRGNGDKGMRVWDFGWQTTEDWRRRDALAVVRLEMHATDPAFLESRLGQADSEGCIRIPARVNSFIDHHGLLDRQLDLMVRNDAPNARAVRALLGAEHTPGPLQGDRIVVVDSSDPQAIASDPEKARRIQESFAQYLASSATPGAASSAGVAASSRPVASPPMVASGPLPPAASLPADHISTPLAPPSAPDASAPSQPATPQPADRTFAPSVPASYPEAPVPSQTAVPQSDPSDPSQSADRASTPSVPQTTAGTPALPQPAEPPAPSRSADRASTPSVPASAAAAPDSPPPAPQPIITIRPLPPSPSDMAAQAPPSQPFTPPEQDQP